MVTGRDDGGDFRCGPRQRPPDHEAAARPGFELDLHSGAGQVIGHQLHARRVDPRLRTLREAAAAREDAPVVEHLRDVEDRSGAALEHPQHQVMILGAIDARPEAAEATEQRRPHREGVVHVVLGKQPLAIEVGLEARF